jgi:carboxypeptidase Q
MIRLHFATPAVLLVALVAAQAQPQARKPSTPEDRAKAVEIARTLESDPLSKQAKEQRNWIIHWLIDVPDLSVKVCGNLLGPVLDSNKNYAPEIFTQMVPSAAAFIISNPEKPKDDIAIYTAAVEGALRTYQSILKMKPKARWPFLDGLIEKRDKGELADHIRQAATHCK